MKNTNVKNISDFVSDDTRAKMWQEVTDALNTVLTLDKVNAKPLQRTGKVMQKALNDLFFALNEYAAIRKN